MRLERPRTVFLVETDATGALPGTVATTVAIAQARAGRAERPRAAPNEEPGTANWPHRGAKLDLASPGAVRRLHLCHPRFASSSKDLDGAIKERGTELVLAADASRGPRNHQRVVRRLGRHALASAGHGIGASEEPEEEGGGRAVAGVVTPRRSRRRLLHPPPLACSKAGERGGEGLFVHVFSVYSPLPPREGEKKKENMSVLLAAYLRESRARPLRTSVVQSIVLAVVGKLVSDHLRGKSKNKGAPSTASTFSTYSVSVFAAHGAFSGVWFAKWFPRLEAIVRGILGPNASSGRVAVVVKTAIHCLVQNPVFLVITLVYLKLALPRPYWEEDVDALSSRLAAVAKVFPSALRANVRLCESCVFSFPSTTRRELTPPPPPPHQHTPTHRGPRDAHQPLCHPPAPPDAIWCHCCACVERAARDADGLILTAYTVYISTITYSSLVKVPISFLLFLLRFWHRANSLRPMLERMLLSPFALR